MRPVGQGLLLGVANVVFIACGLAVLEGELEIAVLVTMFGMVPGAVLGAVLGLIAKATQAHSIWLRRVALIVPAVLLVIWLGSEFTMEDFILVSCIPTVVAAVVLERATRLVVPPPVPVAHARKA